MVKANVWANVKAIMDVAIVMIKIHAHLDQPAYLALQVPMENQELMEAKDRQAHRELLLIGITEKPHQDVKNARMDRKDPTDQQVQLAQQAKKVVPAAKAAMENPADPVQLVQLAVQAQQVETANLDLVARKERMPHLAPKVLLELPVKKEELAQAETKEEQEQQAKQVQPAPLAHLVPLEVQAKMAKMEEKEYPDHLEAQARMPNTALAPIVPRKHKQSQHWINPNTILGQQRFDNDNQYFQLSLKLIVSMMICIYNRVDLVKQFT